MKKEEIFVAFSAGGPSALGNVWRITAKKTDFYLDPLWEEDAVHLSVHGPSKDYPNRHRFHVKVNRKNVATLKARGNFIIHSIPRKGYAFDGQELAPDAFRVARIRWRWDLQRGRFQQAAAVPGPLPEISDNQSGARLDTKLDPNDAADLDLVISYNKPYWPNKRGSLRDNARLGPLRNEAGMWLTATSYRRSQMKYPAPEGIISPLPRGGEEPNRSMCGALGQNGDGDMYWFVEGITSRQFILKASQPNTRA